MNSRRWAQGLALLALLVPATFAPAAAHSLDLGRYLPPPDAAYVAEEVRVHAAGGYSLAGTLTLPSRGVLRNGHVMRYAAILLLSGAGKDDRDGDAADDTTDGYRPLRDLADALTRRGIAVLRLDDRGVGASTGTLDSSTTLDRTDDARAAIGYLRRRIEVDPKRIGVLGMSEGASIAALVAATDPDVRGIVLMAGPGLPGREIAAWQRSKRLAADPSLSPARRDTSLAGGMAEWDANAQADPWYRFFATYDPRVTARAVAAPALVMQGGDDESVPPAGADSLVAALRVSGADVSLRRFPGLGHAFLPPSAFDAGPGASPGALRLPPAILGPVTDWVVAHFGGGVEGPAPRLKPLHRRRRH